MIIINYLDERELVVKREINTKLSMTPKYYGIQVLSIEDVFFRYTKKKENVFFQPINN